jgi:hypothetical protein
MVFGFEFSVSGFTVEGLGCRVCGMLVQVQGLYLRIWGAGYEI